MSQLGHNRPPTPLLDTLNDPADLRKLKESELPQVAAELRAELIDAVLVDGHGTALDLVRELRADTGGRASFLCHAAAAALPAGPGPAGGRPRLEAM